MGGSSEERKVMAGALVELFTYVEIEWKMGPSTSSFQPLALRR